MAGYPVVLNLEGRLCLVVGAGRVGLRKISQLRSAGARVRVVDPRPSLALQEIPDVELVSRPFSEGDLDDVCLVFACTDQREVNEEVALQARRLGLFVNVADLPGGGDFAVPALHRQGDVLVTVSTDGGSPLLAAHLRDQLAAGLDEAWAVVGRIASALRQKRLTPSDNDEYNHQALRSLLADNLVDLVASGDSEGVDRLLRKHFGDGVSLTRLGIHLPRG